MTVLILTAPEDLTADMVVQHFGKVRVARLDPAEFPGRVELSTSWTAGGVTGRIDDGTHAIDLASVQSVWVRRPGRPSIQGVEQAAWVAHEAEHALYGALRALPGVRWMNHPDAQAAARYKITQLATARAVGFAIPETLVTTSPDDAERFAKDGPTVVKAVSGRQPFDPPMALPTSLVPPGADFSSVATAPTCFQRGVDKIADLRVTVVSKTQFWARIEAEHDWRFDDDPNPWQPAPEPKNLASKVSAFMRAYGLTYGAFDFAVDRAGKVWFLECNPSGQFGFIEIGTAQPIAQHVADWLANRASSSVPGAG
ncbi:MvdC/MvdD family ATP grasp protein [Streptomyces sp. NPDC007172]|uniref:MvdC/MvdD family ATP grasp protein n=1 Tax=Streptomyces sp. NPDC007172 TaxID=3364776 RepID=UPI00368DE449